MYTAFINDVSLTPLMATIPALFAKSSLVWPAILNIQIQKNERKKMFDVVLNEINSFFHLKQEREKMNQRE